jgi:hypothetical protein
MPNWVNTVQSATTAVSVVPQSISANIGQSFSIDVVVSDAIDLYAWEIELDWTASLLGTANIIEGPFLRTSGSTFFVYSSNDTLGHILIDCTLLGQIVGVNGSGVLATVTFLVLDAGETPLDLHDEVLLDRYEGQIACQVTDGYCNLGPSHDVVIVNVEAFPTITLTGNLVNINVTVEDVGAYDENFNVTVFAGLQMIGMQTISLNSCSSASLEFVWNTTGYEKGDYTISAQASVVQGEVNVVNNSEQAVNPVTLLLDGHDLAVTVVEPSKTIVGQGYTMQIKVIVKNYGVFSEASNTAVYANTTTIWLEIDELASGLSVTLTVVWNTSSFTKGNFTASAHAEPVPDELDIVDNQHTSNVPVHVGIPGDVSGPTIGVYDGICNMRDINYVIMLFNTKPSSPNWDPNADVNNDGVCNMRDIQIAILNFNKHE